MSAHTPGPLQVLHAGNINIVVIGPNYEDIAEFFHCDEATVSTSREEALANARLFVAAGGLLEALKAFLTIDSRAYLKQSDLAKDLITAKKNAWAAIKKATAP